MLVDVVMKYYDKKYDLNCAECMLVAANEEYDLNISKQTMMTMSSFGGGMAVGSVCGAVTGGAAVIGLMFTTENGHKSPQVKEITSRFINEYNRRMESLECIPLREKYYEQEVPRCTIMMRTAGEILQDLIEEYKEVYIINR